MSKRTKQYTEAEFITLLRGAVAEHGSQKAFAKHIGVSEPYLTDVLLGRRHPSPRILEPLGLRKVVEIVYVTQ